MKKIILFELIFSLALITQVHALSSYTITTNNVFQSIFNITFIENQNQSFNVSIPKNAVVINAKLNLSGFLNIINITYNSNADLFNSPIADANKDVCWYNGTITSGNITMVGIKAYIISGTYWQSHINLRLPNGTIPGDIVATSNNFNLTNVAEIRNATFSTPYQLNSSGIWICYTFTTISDAAQYKFSAYSSINNVTFFNAEEYVFGGWVDLTSNSPYPSISIEILEYNNNSYLDIGNDGTQEWNFIGIFNQLNNQTADLSYSINSYLSSCTANSNGYCNVPFALHSGNIIQISGINITGNISINNCTSGTPFLIFNGKNEETENIMNYSQDMTMSIVDPYNLMSINNSFQFRDNSTYFVCISPSWATFYIDATIKYYATGFSDRYYYFDKAVLTNSTQNINLYLLNSSLATLVTINVLDQMSNPQSGIIIMVQRQNIGTDSSLLVEERLTDYTGKAYTYLKIGEIYSFVLIKNNVILNQYKPMPVQINTLIFYVSQSSVPEYFSYYGNIATSCNLDNSTNSMICTFIDMSGLPMNMTLLVIQRTVAGDIQYCLNTSSSSSGTFICNLAANYSYKGSLIGTYYSSPRNYVWQSWTVSLFSSVNIFGKMGLLVSLLIALMAPFLGIYDARIAILLNGVAMIFCLWFGFLYGGTNTSLLIVLVTVIDGIVIYKIRT